MLTKCLFWDSCIGLYLALPALAVLAFWCPMLRLYNLLLLLKAEVLLTEVPVCMCLSHGARVCRSTVCLLDELLPSGNHCSDTLQGMIAQMLYWHKKGWSEKLRAGGRMGLLWWCVCWHKLYVDICSRAETAIFHWNTSPAVFQSHVSEKQGHNCWYWVENW